MPRSLSPKTILDEHERRELAEVLQAAARRTSAAVKVVILRHGWGDIRSKAIQTFRAMGMDRAEARNGVLILVATADREYAIYGDRGIHRLVGQEFWDNVRDVMARSFEESEMGRGLCDAVTLAAGMLEQHFPDAAGGKVEAPDAVA